MGLIVIEKKLTTFPTGPAVLKKYADVVFGFNASRYLVQHYAEGTPAQELVVDDALTLHVISPDIPFILHGTREARRSHSDGSDAEYLAEAYWTDGRGIRYGLLLQRLRATQQSPPSRATTDWYHPAFTSRHYHPVGNTQCPGLTEEFYPLMPSAPVKARWRNGTSEEWEPLREPLIVLPGELHQLRCDDPRGVYTLLHVRGIPEPHTIRTMPHCQHQPWQIAEPVPA